MSIVKFVSLVLCLISTGANGRKLRHRKLVFAEEGTAIEGQYIVVLNEDVKNVDSEAVRLVENSDAAIEKEFDVALKAFTVSGLRDDALTTILNDEGVKFVEEDGIIQEDGFDHVQYNTANWGLDFIAAPMGDRQYSYTFTGKGVTVVTLDTGIYPEHNEFEGKSVTCGKSVISDEKNCIDYRGHGSHVAGLAVGKKYGVAKDADLVSIKVLDRDGAGSKSGVVEAVDYVAEVKKNYPDKPIVVNMSLGGGTSDAINGAVKDAIKQGAVFVVSAGNNGYSACRKSPASVEEAVTVAAVNEESAEADYSNFGKCVDVYAPGTNLLSAWIGSTSATKLKSGTSMASPLVAGIAALYLEQHPEWTQAQVKNAILNDARRNAVSGITTSNADPTPNVLVSTNDLYRKSVNNPSASPVSWGNNGEIPFVPGPSETMCLTSFTIGCDDASTTCCSNTCSFNTCWPDVLSQILKMLSTW